MAEIQNFRWIRVLVAIVTAEVLPILLLVAIIMVYAVVTDQTQADAMRPEEFAPVAGNWVGPIGGFLSTLFLSWWAARVCHHRVLLHGMSVGMGAAIFDLCLFVFLSGGESLSILLALSNSGRILAGFLGGYIALKQHIATLPPEPAHH